MLRSQKLLKRNNLPPTVLMTLVFDDVEEGDSVEV
jgi:hypothetical protein